MNEAAQKLERLIDTLERAAAGSADRPPDAIDRVLGSAPRATNSRALRDHPSVARFREDLANGLVRIETTSALLDVLDRLVRRFAGI